MSAPTVEVIPATADQRGVLENLLQLYIHDFSEYWAGLDRGELQEDGLFEPYPLGPYWAEPDHLPFLIRVDGYLAGFALLNRESHVGDALDRNMAEFFIVRKHRRGGVGVKAVNILFDRFPGAWELAVARRNVQALSFWRRVVQRREDVSQARESDLETAQWNGPVLSFRVG